MCILHSDDGVNIITVWTLAIRKSTLGSCGKYLRILRKYPPWHDRDMLVIWLPDELTQLFIALDKLPRWVYPISICVILHHPGFPHTASPMIQYHFVSSLHCSWTTSSTIPLTLPPAPLPTATPALWLFLFSRSPSALPLQITPNTHMCWTRGKTSQQASLSCPKPSPIAPEKDPSAFLLLFFFRNCVGTPHPCRGNKSPPSWDEEDQRSP